MGGNLRLCSNSQNATLYKGGKIKCSFWKWVDRRKEILKSRKCTKKGKAGLLLLQDRLYFSFMFYEVFLELGLFSSDPSPSSFFFFLKIFLLASMGGSDYTPNLLWNSEHFHIWQRLKSLSIAWSWACCHVKSFWVQSQFAIIFSFPDRFTLNLVRQN